MSILAHGFDETEIIQLPEDITINGKLIPKGYVNATRICKPWKFKLRAWIKSDSTQRYLEALGESLNIPVSELITEVEGEFFEGEYYFWVHPRIEIAICRSIDPDFAVCLDNVGYLSVKRRLMRNGEDFTVDEALALFPSFSIKQKDPNGVVYLIECKQNNALKIGFTKNIDSRLKGLQGSNPSELKVLYTLNGTIELEKELLVRFKTLQIRGEWFKWDKSIVSTFKARSESTQKSFI